MKITKYKTKNINIFHYKQIIFSIELINSKMKENLEIFLCIFITHFE